MTCTLEGTSFCLTKLYAEVGACLEARTASLFHLENLVGRDTPHPLPTTHTLRAAAMQWCLTWFTSLQYVACLFLCIFQGPSPYPYDPPKLLFSSSKQSPIFLISFLFLSLLTGRHLLRSSCDLLKVTGLRKRVVFEALRCPPLPRDSIF